MGLPWDFGLILALQGPVEAKRGQSLSHLLAFANLGNTYSTCTGCDDGGGAGRGFVAVPGWDAQTGFGQPLFPGLLKHLSAD